MGSAREGILQPRATQRRPEDQEENIFCINRRESTSLSLKLQKLEPKRELHGPCIGYRDYVQLPGTRRADSHRPSVDAHRSTTDAFAGQRSSPEKHSQSFTKETIRLQQTPADPASPPSLLATLVPGHPANGCSMPLSVPRRHPEQSEGPPQSPDCPIIEAKTYHFRESRFCPVFPSNGPRSARRKVSGETLAIRRPPPVTPLENHDYSDAPKMVQTYHLMRRILPSGPTSSPKHQQEQITCCAEVGCPTFATRLIVAKVGRGATAPAPSANLL